MGGKVRRNRRVKKGRAETDPIRRKGESDARGGERAAPCRTKGYGERSGKEGSEKSSAAYVGFRARLAATAVAAALIRVGRYEIIKLGLDGGEGDGVAGEGWQKRGVASGRRKGGTGGNPRWMSEAMGRWKVQRRGRGTGG